ncbi:MAG: hypothetical protein ACQESG_06130 [Nanobdellota archaeon]
MCIDDTLFGTGTSVGAEPVVKTYEPRPIGQEPFGQDRYGRIDIPTQQSMQGWGKREFAEYHPSLLMATLMGMGHTKQEVYGSPVVKSYETQYYRALCNIL